MAGACSCESCLGKACGSLKQCLWPVAARVASMAPAAARVALERPVEGFEALSGACSCESCLGKACGKV